MSTALTPAAATSTLTLGQLCERLRSLPEDYQVQNASHVSGFSTAFALSCDVAHEELRQTDEWQERRILLESIEDDFDDAVALAFEGITDVSVGELLTALQDLNAKRPDMLIMSNTKRAIGLKHIISLETDDLPFRETDMALTGKAACKHAFELACTMAAKLSTDTELIASVVLSVLPSHWKFTAYRVGTELYSDTAFFKRYPRATQCALISAFKSSVRAVDAHGKPDPFAADRVVIYTAREGITHEILDGEFGPRKSDQELASERLARVVEKARTVAAVAAAE